MKITVIGAGLAGLTAAHRLQQAGFSVNVLEKSQSPGGRMAEAHDLGLNYLTGARLIYSFSKSVMRLVRELDLAGQLRHGLTTPVSTCSLMGEHPVQMSPGPRLIFNSPLSGGQRWRLLQLALWLAARRFSVNPDRLLDWHDYDEGSLYEFFNQRSLGQVSKIYIEPIFRGARGWRMTDVSPVFFLSTTAHMHGASAYTFDDGIGALTERLAQSLDVTYCADVKNVIRTVSGGCELSYELKGLLYSACADLVICAVPGPLSARIVSEPTLEEAQFFKSVKYSSGYIVHFGINRSVEPYVRFLSRDVNTSIAAVEVVDQSRTASSYLSRISVYLSPEMVIDLNNKPVVDGELPSIWNDLPDDVARHLEPGYGHVVQQRIQNMLPLFYPGYLKELSAFERYQTNSRKQIYYAGDYLSHALLGGACRSGEDIAQAVISNWSG